jgi:hypothetical protein
MLFVVFYLAVLGGMAQAPSTAPVTTGFSVSGRLLTESGTPLVSGTVVISAERRAAPRDDAAAEATISPDGSFVFRDVRPGEYLIRARARTDRAGVSLFATFRVTVRARDVRDVDLLLKPGAIMRGEIVVEARHGSTRPPHEQLRVRAPLPNGSSFGDARGAPVGRDRSFTLQGVMEGMHVLTVEGLPFPWRIADARILGHDAAERAFDVEARQQIDGIRIVLADIGSGVRGIVAVAPGTRLSLADVLVVAFPADPLRRTLPLRFTRVARPAADGSYRILDLPALDYYVVAAAGLAEQDALDPDLIAHWIDASTPVKLQETQISTIPLTASRATAKPTAP